MNVSRQIGWSNESNLLYQILKQITKLTAVVFGLKPKYKVFTALLTQSGTDNIVSLTSGELVIGTTYRIKTYTEGDDFTNVGAPNNNVDTYFIATGTTPSNWTNSSELNYNEGTPTVIVLENTIGNIWFTYQSPGIYLLNSDNLFITNKTFMDNAGLEAYNVFNRIINDGIFSTQRGYYFIKQDESIINLKTLEDPETSSDDIISSPICMEIRVYN